MAQENLKYKRVIIKLSGEALAGENGTGIDAEKLTYVCKEIADVKALGVDVGIVIGGGGSCGRGLCQGRGKLLERQTSR